MLQRSERVAKPHHCFRIAVGQGQYCFDYGLEGVQRQSSFGHNFAQHRLEDFSLTHEAEIARM